VTSPFTARRLPATALFCRCSGRSPHTANAVRLFGRRARQLAGGDRRRWGFSSHQAWTWRGGGMPPSTGDGDRAMVKSG